jgi:hypothetical protein
MLLGGTECCSACSFCRAALRTCGRTEHQKPRCRLLQGEDGSGVQNAGRWVRGGAGRLAAGGQGGWLCSGMMKEVHA